MTVAVLVAVGDAVRVGVAVSGGVGEGVFVGVSVGVAVEDGLGVKVSVGVGVAVGVSVGVDEGVGEFVGVGEGLSKALFCANSEVFPKPSVAVAVTSCPAAPLTVTEKFPAASADPSPMKVFPSPALSPLGSFRSVLSAINISTWQLPQAVPDTVVEVTSRISGGCIPWFGGL